MPTGLFMTTIDWILIAVVAISGLISLKRGFVREALSLASWVIAFIVARYFSANLATLLVGHVETNTLRWALAFAALFAGTLVICALINHLMVEIVRVTGLSGTDRVFGMVFGISRGLLIIVTLVYLAQFTPAPSDNWWKESRVIPHLEPIADWARKTLPGAVSRVLAASSN